MTEDNGNVEHKELHFDTKNIWKLSNFLQKWLTHLNKIEDCFEVNMDFSAVSASL
jgi:hypothetical protein